MLFNIYNIYIKIRTKFNLKFPLFNTTCKVAIGTQIAATHVLNRHNLKKVTMLKPSMEYNRRTAIIESVRAGRSATEIILFFRSPRSTVYDVIVKYNESEGSNEGSATLAKKSHSKERVVKRPDIILRAQDLICE